MSKSLLETFKLNWSKFIKPFVLRVFSIISALIKCPVLNFLENSSKSVVFPEPFGPAKTLNFF